MDKAPVITFNGPVANVYINNGTVKNPIIIVPPPSDAKPKNKPRQTEEPPPTPEGWGTYFYNTVATAAEQANKYTGAGNAAEALGVVVGLISKYTNNEISTNDWANHYAFGSLPTGTFHINEKQGLVVPGILNDIPIPNPKDSEETKVVYGTGNKGRSSGLLESLGINDQIIAGESPSDKAIRIIQETRDKAKEIIAALKLIKTRRSDHELVIIWQALKRRYEPGYLSSWWNSQSETDPRRIFYETLIFEINKN